MKRRNIHRSSYFAIRTVGEEPLTVTERYTAGPFSWRINARKLRI